MAGYARSAIIWFVRWIGSLVVAACLVAAGAIRPARAERRDPTDVRLAAAVFAGKLVAPRHGKPGPEPRRATVATVATVAQPTDGLPPPARALLDAADAAGSTYARPEWGARSSRGPPR